MTSNQKKILKYLEETIYLDDKELILDYDNNSVVVIDTVLNLTIIFHFIYINNTVRLVNNKIKK